MPSTKCKPVGEITQSFGVMHFSNSGAPFPNALWSFTFLHSLDGMESTSESSAMEEAHGDEHGSLSSSARKLFALWERKRSVVRNFLFYFFMFPLLPFILCPKVPFSMVYNDNLPNFLTLSKRICTLATWVANLGSSDSLILQDSRRNNITSC